MIRKTDRLLRRVPAAAFLVATAIILTILPATVARADTPHVRFSVDTDSCAACHTAHADVSANATQQAVVGDDPTAVCLSCHDGDPNTANVGSGTTDSFSLASGHSLVATSPGTVAMTGCSACHDSHAASATDPMMPGRDVNGVKGAASGPQLCMACHDTPSSWYGPDYPSTSAPTRDATGFPVAGTWPGPSTYTSSTNLHRLIPETTQTAAGGEDVVRQEGDCLYCHAAHRGANEYDSLLTTFTVPTPSTLTADKSDGTYAALCFTCHGGVTPSGFTSQPVDIKRYATAIDGSAGHSIVTSGGTLPVGSPLPCFECHNPHGSKRGNESMLSDERGANLSTANQAGVRQFCFTCHTTADTTSGWDSDSQMYTAVSSASKVVGIARDGGVLRLPPGDGHNQADDSSCYDCHGHSYDAGGHNVHDPDSGASNVTAPSLLAVSLQTSDTVPPITIADMSQAGTGTVVLNAVDLGSGVQSTYYSLDGSSPATGTTLYVSQDGTHTLDFWSVDVAGNVEATNTVTFAVDRTPPVTTSDAVPSYVGTATITLSSADATGGSGVNATYYQLDGAPDATGTVVVATGVGSHTLLFWSVDDVGNVEATQTVTFAITADPSVPLLAQPLTAPADVPTQSVAPVSSADSSPVPAPPPG